MLKVNVFAQYPKGGSFYKSQYCTSGTTINELINRCGLSTFGASVYLNGTRLNKQQWDMSVFELGIHSFAFLSLRYGEIYKTETKSRKTIGE